jgi:pseudaminic acid biosynthesis-associated methylase
MAAAPDTAHRNAQEQFWSGDFGAQYNERNNFTEAGLDELYQTQFGLTRKAMNERFLAAVPHTSRLLEVGCNLGLQLRHLRAAGYTALYGIELQWDAVQRCRQTVPLGNVLQGSGFDVPFRDAWFDLSYTSGVLIHIAPENLRAFMAEVVRTSKRWVWGFEYHAEEVTSIPYRGNEGFLWKADYAKLYREWFPELHLVQHEVYPYQDGSGNADAMFLLEKR